MKRSKKLQISSHLLFVYINNQDRKWRMSVLVFSSALVIHNKGYILWKISHIKVLYFHFLLLVDTLVHRYGAFLWTSVSFSLENLWDTYIPNRSLYHEMYFSTKWLLGFLVQDWCLVLIFFWALILVLFFSHSNWRPYRVSLIKVLDIIDKNIVVKAVDKFVIGQMRRQRLLR